jgi:hypothetical protein
MAGLSRVQVAVTEEMAEPVVLVVFTPEAAAALVDMLVLEV